MEKRIISSSLSKWLQKLGTRNWGTSSRLTPERELQCLKNSKQKEWKFSSRIWREMHLGIWQKMAPDRNWKCSKPRKVKLAVKNDSIVHGDIKMSRVRRFWHVGVTWNGNMCTQAWKMKPIDSIAWFTTLNVLMFLLRMVWKPLMCFLTYLLSFGSEVRLALEGPEMNNFWNDCKYALTFKEEVSPCGIYQSISVDMQQETLEICWARQDCVFFCLWIVDEFL